MDRADAERDSRDWPMVTTQIPVYNEGPIALRVIEAVAATDYPTGRHEIQVLDDSTDETCALIDEVADRLRHRGVDINVIRRSQRTGYKAGALSNGLHTARGKYDRAGGAPRGSATSRASAPPRFWPGSAGGGAQAALLHAVALTRPR